MSLAYVQVANYRSFVESTEIELKPLTLIFGENNAGKSALVRVPPLLSASVVGPPGEPLALRSQATRASGFRDLLSRLTSSPVLSIGWSQTNGSAAQLDVRDLPDRRQQIAERVAVQLGSKSATLEWTPNDHPEAPEQPYICLETKDKVNLTFSGLLPSSSTGLTEPLQDLLQACRASVLELSREVQWLGSLRALPQRMYLYSGRPDQLLGPAGEGAAEMLAFDQLADGEMLKDVNAWFGKHMGSELSVVDVGESFSLTFGRTGVAHARANLVDAGEGIAQVLPVLVALARARMSQGRTGGLLLLEQPELHLHPGIHAALAAHLCESVAMSDAHRVVVETHSKNVLLAVQLEILRGHIPASRVAVYWVRQDSQGRSTAEKIIFDDQARLTSNWPPNALMQDVEYARLIQEKRRPVGDE